MENTRSNQLINQKIKKNETINQIQSSTVPKKRTMYHVESTLATKKKCCNKLIIDRKTKEKVWLLTHELWFPHVPCGDNQ